MAASRGLAFLCWPIPKGSVAAGALRGRAPPQHELSVRGCAVEVARRSPHGTGAPRPIAKVNMSTLKLTDFPGADWTASYRSIMTETGVCSNVAVRLRAEAAASIKPHRKGRRAFSFTDFDLDWKSLSTKKIMELTGVSRPLAVCRTWSRARI